MIKVYKYTPVELGEMIRQKRGALPQYEMARQLGITTSTYSRMENGKFKNPNRELIVQILGEDIFTGESVDFNSPNHKAEIELRKEVLELRKENVELKEKLKMIENLLKL